MTIATATPRRPAVGPGRAAARLRRARVRLLHELRQPQGRGARREPVRRGRSSTGRALDRPGPGRGDGRAGVDRDESEAYFASRPARSPGRRVGVAAERADRRPGVPRSARLDDAEARFADPTSDVPLPPFWGGYRLAPDVFEFWVNRERPAARPHPLPARRRRAGSSSGWRRDRRAGRVLAGPALVLDERHVDDDPADHEEPDEQREHRADRAVERGRPAHDAAGSRTCRRSSAPRRTRRRRSRPGASPARGMRRVGSIHAVHRKQQRVDDEPADDAELREARPVADERQHRTSASPKSTSPPSEPDEPEQPAPHAAAGDAPGLVPRRGERRGQPGPGPQQTDDADDARRDLRVAARSSPRR